VKNIEKLGEVISTDVLVIGGGISGMCAAMKAKESQVDVKVIDKGAVGWAGHVPIAGGAIIDVPPGQEDEWFNFAVRNGGYLNNQDWTYAFAENIHRNLTELFSWGFPFVTIKGEIAILSRLKDYATTQFAPAKSMIKLKSAAKARGVGILDKIFMVDLLQQDGKVVGAIGFSLLDGKTYIFHSKAVIIASSSCRYQRAKLFAAISGEGPAMAYRAGAQLMNDEFHNNYGYELKATGTFHRHAMYLFFENALGERIIEKYYPEVAASKERGKEIQDFWQIADAMYREVQAGRGPIYLDLTKLTPEEREIATTKRFVELDYGALPPPIYCMRAFQVLREKAGIDPDKDKIEVQPMFTVGQGPLRIDLNCKTTLDGLWAVGDAASLGSGWTGARASGTHPGWSIAFAIVSGFRGGQSAGEHAATADKVEIDYERAKQIKKRIFAPLGRQGDMRANDIIYQVHEAIVPMKYNFYREAGRLKEAIGIVDKARQSLVRVGAKDAHELMRYHQAESMVLSAEWDLRSALMREESRGTHYREDFPYRDDKNWLKWLVIKEEKGLPRLWTENVPIEKYRLKPK